MNRTLGLVLLVTGVALLVMGLNASESIASEVSEFFSGAPSNKAVWLMIGGAVCAALGIGSLARSSSH